jgi:hypothetical protein
MKNNLMTHAIRMLACSVLIAALTLIASHVSAQTKEVELVKTPMVNVPIVPMPPVAMV